jgi:putative AdoMet-dependent methyltransferase
MNPWLFDETRHCGVDYSNNAQAQGYDSRHQKFRDFEKEFLAMLEFIGRENTQEKTIIDLGCGTGATAIHASQNFKKVYAVDISEPMILQARQKAEADSIKNIEFVNAGFLSYEHKDTPADVLMTRAAFHHLPDFWKQIALLKMNRMIKMEGVLYIFDVVFGFEPAEFKTVIENWISYFELKAGKEFRKEAETHIRDEFSTFSWILEGMISKAGFFIEKSRTVDGFTTEYCCKKIKEVYYNK